MREITALSSHYPVSTKSPTEQARWLEDFANDLYGYSGPTVEKACTRWRTSPDNRRFPTPGQLILICAIFQPPPPQRTPPNIEYHSGYNRERIAAPDDPELAERVKQEVREWLDEKQARKRATPSFSPPQGEVGPGGITPQLRALMERRVAE